MASNASETPTATELADYAGTDPVKKAAAKVAITAKAQAWYNRNQASITTNASAFVTANSISAPAVIGARYLSPKEDGNSSTGQTTYYPAGIEIVIDEPDPYDPDDNWGATQGFESGDIAWIFLNSGNAARRKKVGRHEAGHASDHESFGTGDHATSGLMTPTGDSDTFSDDSILRLRGWKP